MKTIAIAGTFDSKGEEFAYVKKLVEGLGLQSLMIHTGVFEPLFEPDVSNRAVAEAAGADLDALVAAKDRAEATEALARGFEQLLPKLYAEGRFDGILSFGGSGGTALATPGMRALPIGVPKVMVSTMASGNTSQYVGTSDIVMMPSVVDVSGLNSLSTTIFQNAVFAIAGMVTHERKKPETEKPLVAASMFGVTTPCINMAKAYLEEQGYEVLVFHATGIGGRSMEDLIRAGFIKGVLDITTTEWCDEVVGGVLNAGPNRLEAAALKGVPQVVSVGAVDMVNFGPYETVPHEFAGRLLYKHNPTVTLMRTTPAENRTIGAKIAEKLNMASGKTALMLPLKGVSLIAVEGQPFYDPDADQALFETLRNSVDRQVVEVVEMDAAVNDESFALAAARKLVALMNA